MRVEGQGWDSADRWQADSRKTAGLTELLVVVERKKIMVVMSSARFVSGRRSLVRFRADSSWSALFLHREHIDRAGRHGASR